MPIIITRPRRASGSGRASLRLVADTSPLPEQPHGTGRAALRLAALTLTGGRAALPLRASSAARVGRASLTLSARSAPRHGSARLPLFASTHATDTGRARVVFGVKPRRYRVRSGELKVLSFEYQRTARGRELVMVVPGEVRLDERAQLTLQVTDLRTGRDWTATVPCDGEYSVERLPAGGARTTLRGADPDYGTLQNTRLDELIPWVGNPSRALTAPGFRSVTRQVVGVLDVLTHAFQAAGQTFMLDKDLLRGQRWEETRREYSTRGKSPLDVFRDTYGALGYELVWMRPGVWRAFAPEEYSFAVEPDLKAVLPGNEVRRTLQYPSAVQIQVGDKITERSGYLLDVATTGSLPDQALDGDGKPVKVEIRDPQAAVMEVAQDATLSGRTANEDGTLTAFMVEKSAGRIVRSVEVTIGDVQSALEVTPQAGGTPRMDFRGVLLSRSETVNAYMGPRSPTLASTRTTVTRYAYSFVTVPAPVALPVELGVGLVYAGDLLGSESSSEVYVYSHAGGVLRQHTKSEEKITAAGRENADSTDPATPPSVPVALERNRTVTVETWTAIGGGLWRHATTRTAHSKLPVRDLASGDWVAQINAPSVTTSSEIVDNAPPSVSDPDIPGPDAQGMGGRAGGTAAPVPDAPEILRDPQIQTVTLDGRADVVSVSVPCVEDQLGDLARALAHVYARELAPRVDRAFRSVAVEGINPRMYVAGFGLARSVKVSGKVGSIITEVLCEQRDP